MATASTKSSTKYNFTYRGTGDTTRAPTTGTLAMAIAAAADYDSRILLTSRNGEDRGWVKSDGTWSLT